VDPERRRQHYDAELFFASGDPLSILAKWRKDDPISLDRWRAVAGASGR